MSNPGPLARATAQVLSGLSGPVAPLAPLANPERVAPVDVTPQAILDERAIARALAKVPLRYRDAEVDNAEVAGWVAQVLAGGTASLTVLGPVGTGKTHQGWGAVRALAHGSKGKLVPAAWSTVELLDALRPHESPAVDRADLLSLVQRASVLYLDDLAVEKASEFTSEVLYRVLDYRYAWMLPTLVTSNYPPKDLSAAIGDRLASRLRGMGPVAVLAGQDRRRTTPTADPLKENP